jgi:hypothetical protein
MAHYIDAPVDKPSEWELKSKVLGFEELQGRHSGANIAAKVVEVLDQYEIRDKASSFICGLTVDSRLH